MDEKLRILMCEDDENLGMVLLLASWYTKTQNVNSAEIVNWDLSSM